MDRSDAGDHRPEDGLHRRWENRVAGLSTGGTERAGWGAVWTALILGAVLALAFVTTGFAGSATTERVSVSSSGEQGNGDSYGYFGAAISADGRYVAFTSDASNLVAGDTNGTLDVFVRDRQLNTTERVSVSSTGHQGKGASWLPAISADGRYVAFTSEASNLVAGDGNHSYDVFVHDRKLDTTKRASVSSTGHQGDGDSWSEAISADGRYVALTSEASNLVARDTNDESDVFVRDRKRHKTSRVSVSTTEHQGDRGTYSAAISADGRYVAFTSYASNLVSKDTHKNTLFVRDRKLGTTRRMSGTGPPGRGSGAAISADGRYVAFDSHAPNLVAADTNDAYDVFVHNRKHHTTSRVSVSSTGDQGNGRSEYPAISADGRYVAFWSAASNLVAGDTNGMLDVFVRDRKHHTTSRVSLSSTGDQGNSRSQYPAISADGRYVAFPSAASNLVAGDTNTADDLFVRGPLP
jgi:Tol biopolymer transport system component